MNAGILIATRNRGAQLLLGLKSILSGKYDPFMKIVVVDDASTDMTPVILTEIGPVVEMYRISRNDGYRKNPSTVLNYGHRLMDTDVVIEQGGEICHITDCVTPLMELCRPGTVALARVHHGTVEEYQQLQTMVNNGQYPFPDDFQPETYRTNGDTWRVPVVNGFRLYCGKERPAPFIFCGAIHREDFEAVGGYDESIPRRNDEDLANRLIARGVKFVFSGKAIAFHLEHGKS